MEGGGDTLVCSVASDNSHCCYFWCRAISPVVFLSFSSIPCFVSRPSYSIAFCMPCCIPGALAPVQSSPLCAMSIITWPLCPITSHPFIPSFWTYYCPFHYCASCLLPVLSHCLASQLFSPIVLPARSPLCYANCLNPSITYYLAMLFLFCSLFHLIAQMQYPGCVWLIPAKSMAYVHLKQFSTQSHQSFIVLHETY